MARTITSSNAIYMLSIPLLFPVPVQLQGFMADAMFDTEATELAEVVMGADGRMSMGYVPSATPQTISIMPDSPSSDMFEAWATASRAARDVYPANASISIIGTGRKYALTQGVLTRAVLIPSAQKRLNGRVFAITWADITPAVA